MRRTRPIVLVLALAASPGRAVARDGAPPPAAPPAAATQEGPGAAAASSAASAGAHEPAPPRPRKQLGTGATIAFLEGVVLALSTAATFGPEATGWTEVLLSPLACAGEGTEHLCPLGIAAWAGIGLTNAVELRSDEYSRGRRFLINVAAWHLAFGVIGAVDWMHERRAPASKEPGAAVAFAVGPDGTPRVVVSGRF